MQIHVISFKLQILTLSHLVGFKDFPPKKDR